MGKPSAGSALHKAWKRYKRQMLLYHLPHLLTAAFLSGAAVGGAAVWLAVKP